MAVRPPRVPPPALVALVTRVVELLQPRGPPVEMCIRASIPRTESASVPVQRVRAIPRLLIAPLMAPTVGIAALELSSTEGARLPVPLLTGPAEDTSVPPSAPVPAFQEGAAVGVPSALGAPLIGGSLVLPPTAVLALASA